MDTGAQIETINTPEKLIDIQGNNNQVIQEVVFCNNEQLHKCSSVNKSNQQSEEGEDQQSKYCNSVLVHKNKKKEFKQVQYSYYSLDQYSVRLKSDLIYMHGDVVLDLARLKNESDRYSAWNLCKIWPITEINKTSRVVMLNLENRYLPNAGQYTKQIQVYKQLPYQNIHSLFKDLESYVFTHSTLQAYITQYFNIIKQNPVMTKNYFQRRQQFDNCMQSKFQEFNDQGLIFFATHSGPDIETNDFIFYRVVIGETFSQILGKSLDEIQDMYRRNGAIEFFDFDSSIEMTRMIVTYQLKIFNAYQQGQEYSPLTSYTFPQQFKIYTYDDMEFYAKVHLKIFKMSDFMKDNDHIMDFYSNILIFDISPAVIQQIINLRSEQNYLNTIENNKNSNDFELKNRSENLEYTIQAEIFKEKYLDPPTYSTLDRNGDRNNKTCKYKQI